MKATIIKTLTGTYKILVPNSNPALEYIASILKSTNQYAQVKIGIYKVRQRGKYKVVESLISHKSERMNRDKYAKFLSGKKQIYVNVKAQKVIAEKEAKDLEEVLNNI